MNHKVTTLKNGLRVITVPMEGTQTVSVIAMVGVGSRFENEKEKGISHFIEHMFFKGTEKRPQAIDISEELDAIGGEFNAYTSKEKTAYYAKVDAKHVEKAMDVIADIFLNSKIEQEEIDKEKGAIMQEISMYEDSPSRNVGNLIEEVLFDGNSLGKNILGTNESVSSFARKDFIDYMQKYYNANDAAVCLAGNFNEEEVVEMAGKYFGNMKSGEKALYDKFEQNQSEPALMVKYKETDQTHLIIANRAFGENHPDRFAASILAVILGGNMSSRLFINIREKEGLAYHIHTSNDMYMDCGYIATQCGIMHKNLQKTIEITLKEYEKISNEKVSEKELQQAKDYIKGKTVMSFEASDEVALFYVDQELSREKILTLEEIFAELDRVSHEDVMRVAKEIFKKSNLNVAIIGPHKNGEEIKKLLNKNYA